MNDSYLDILQARAQRLAKHQRVASKPTEGSNMLLFSLLPETFAVRAECLIEVIRLPEIFHMPGMPPYVTGVFHRRGIILPAINLKLFFNFPKPGLTALDKIVLLRTSRLSFGLLADEVIGLEILTDTDIQPPASNDFAGAIAGIYNHAIPVLDVEVLAGQLFATKNGVQ
ncbi:MAG: chemotaxis protein CheW [Bacteroidetes bacterium]|nr:chemotaxis protein CheW [Bacteroidota bacterium]